MSQFSPLQSQTRLSPDPARINPVLDEIDDPETNNLNKHPMEHTNWQDPALRNASHADAVVDPETNDLNKNPAEHAGWQDAATAPGGRETNPLYADRDDRREGPPQATNTPLEVSNRKQFGGVDGDINMPVRGVVPGNVGLPTQTGDKR